MKVRFTSRAALFLLVILLVFLIDVYPMLVMLLKSIQGPNGLTLQNFSEVFSDKRNTQAILHTFTVASAATCLALVLGTGLAYLTSRTDLPGRGLLRVLVVVPFFTPPFIYAMAWQQLFNPAGYLNKLYLALCGTGQPLFNIYGPLGIILVMTAAGSATVFLLTEDAFRQMDRALEEAGQACGARPVRVVQDITLPIMLPKILAAAVVVFVTEISNFGIPAILGFQVSYYVLTTRIYQVLHEFYRGNSFEAASAMSTVLLVFAVFSLWLKDRAVKQGRHIVQAGKGEQIRLQLGYLKMPLFLLVALLLLISSVLPLIAIGMTSLLKAYGLMPWPGNLTLANFNQLLSLSLVKRALLNTLVLAVSAATIAVVFGTVIAYILTRTNWKIKNWLDVAAATPYAVPGTIVALAMILAFSRPLPVLGISLYNTLWIILIAYVARYLFFVIRTVSAAMSQVSSSFEEAARISGAPWLRSVTGILLPQIQRSILSSWILVFAHTISELTLSILLWSAGNETIAVAVFNLQETGNLTTSSALAVFLLLVSLGGYLLSEYFSRPQKSPG
jgi:iron(III) transport system permease protein